MAKDDRPEGEEDFAALFAASERASRGRPRVPRPQPGDRVRGKIISVGREVVFVELEGGRGEGMLDLAELRSAGGELELAAGDTVEALVAEAGEPGQPVVLRRTLGRDGAGRADLAQAFELGIPVEGTVTGANKGGVDVSVAGARAFCPVSQLDVRHVDDAAAFVGRTMTFRITRYEEDRRGPNMVVSRRALLEEEARARAVETRARLVVGAVLPGVVTSIKDYGAFVDLGGIDGMLHVSEIGYQRDVRPSDVLSVGQHISVQVLRIEKKDDQRRPEQVALSLKSLEKDPWDDAVARFVEGARARGTVTRLEPFGAFVELAPGVEGLVHVSALGGGRALRHPREAVKPGEALDVQVTAIDRARRRISLVPATGDEALDPDARAAADRAASPARLGTLGDLLQTKLGDRKR